MSFFSNALLTALLTLYFASMGQAATVKDVFNGDLLGTNQRYFESVAGIPRESLGDEHNFRIQGCNITATIGGGKVSALRMELTDKCEADLSTFIGTYAPPVNRILTADIFIGSYGGPLNYSADCLSMCGNSYDPSVYASWQGPRAAGFMEVILEVELADDNAINASNIWEEHMTAAMGEDYVINTRFNCDRRFDPVANQAFKDIKITAITVGHGLKTPSC
ncbi:MULTISPECIES: hypothetical protein [Alcaligenes]|uniref:hypothetical protein n=1 Tax=Alcaligenes TaxID=507 RepID=UPI0004CEBAFC|nr:MULTISPECIES: hypothetical protein [Alcaligenes]HRO18838.1 hypothetical protein [Alcaligenes phenolicus]HRP14675.1 hypothetical protein [Alcaligenes phenolicus]